MNFSSTDGSSSYKEKGIREKSCNHRSILPFPISQCTNLPIHSSIHPSTSPQPLHSPKICSRSLEKELHSEDVQRHHNCTCLPRLSGDTGWLWSLSVWLTCVPILLLSLSPLSWDSFLTSAAQTHPIRSLLHCSSLPDGLAVLPEILSHTVFYQSHSKSSSLTRAREKLWLIRLCSPLASFMKAEATMGRVVIKTHTQSKCLIPLKIHNRCLEFNLCISRAQLVLFLVFI